MRRRLRKTVAWREVALEFYRRMYGNRCLKCSAPVEPKDAVLYRMSGAGGELLMVHRGCKP